MTATQIDVDGLRAWMQRAHDREKFSFCCETAEENGLTYEVIEAILARLTTAERERNRIAEALCEEAVRHTKAEHRARAAEARVEAMSEALRQIANGETALPHEEVARAALACPPPESSQARE